MVQNAEWGPPLWRILHTLAERLGQHKVPLLIADEMRAWIAVLQGVEGIMPCPMCRKHYREWRTKRPLEGLYGGADASREWLWALHEEVNGRREVPPENRVTFRELEGLYGRAARSRQDLQQDIDNLVSILQRAGLERLIDGGFLREWRAKLAMLRRIVGA